MKKILIISGLLVVLVLVFLYGGIFTESVNENTIEIFVAYGGWGNERCIFEITDDGRLIANVEDREDIAILGRAKADSLTFGSGEYKITLDPERTKQRVKKLSEKQQKEIDILIEEIKQTGDAFTKESRGMAVADCISFYASVDGKIYETYNGSVVKENALQKLTYKLLDISPIRVRGVPLGNK